MKITHQIYIFIFSIFSITLYASNSNYDLVTSDLINQYYNGFIEHTKDQMNEFALLSKARAVCDKIPFFGKILIEHVVEGAVEREAKRRGYENVKLIMEIADLVLSDRTLINQLEILKENILIEQKYLRYLTDCKQYVLNEIKDISNKKQKLNKMIDAMHQFHVLTLMQESETLELELRIQEDKKNKLLMYNNNNRDESHFYKYLNKYKKSKGTLPPYIFLNMFLTYLFQIDGTVRELSQ